MSRLAREIEQCMWGLNEAEGEGLTARFRFPAEFVGFQGHFPGRPVLPAVCKIQAAIAVLEAWSKGDVELREIVSAKFLDQVTCGEEVVVGCTVTMQDSDQAIVKATVGRNGKSVAKFKLRVVFGSDGRGCP